MTARRQPSSVPVREEPEKQERLVLDLSKDNQGLTDDELAILFALEGRLCTADDVIERTGIPAKRVLSALTMLQVRGFVKEEAGKRFRTPLTLEGYQAEAMSQI